MDLLSWIILAAVALWFVAALRHIIRHRGGCSCGQGGKACDGNCSACHHCRKH